MAYTNSPLVAYTKISPNRTSPRNHVIDRITPHCVVGQCSAESLGALFAETSRQASSNYGIDKDGRVGMYCEEKDRSWCSSNRENDHRAITIEAASDTSHPYAMYDVVYESLIKLCTDICKRNGKKKLLWIADKTTALAYEPKADEMLITVHRWFAYKACPGNWLYERLGDLALKVTEALEGTTSNTPVEPAPETPKEEKPSVNPYPEQLTEGLYRVRKTWEDTRSQIGAYRYLSNAKRRADNYPGYKVFSDDGIAIYPEQENPAEPEKSEEESENDNIYTVRKDDTLYEIAKAHLGNGGRYPEIKKLNGLKSNIIYVGMKLKLPMK